MSPPSPVECVAVLLQHRSIAAPGHYSNLTAGAFTSPLFQKNCHLIQTAATLDASIAARARTLYEQACLRQISYLNEEIIDL
jgi:hypothetical protein